MDKQSVLKYWTSLKDALLPQWKRLASGLAMFVGMVIISVSYNLTSTKEETTTACKPAASTTPRIPESCPWQLVMSDLAHRLRLLEMAFKEQVIAREVIAAEVTNQTYSNVELEKRLEGFSSLLRQMSHRIDKINDQMSELSSRLYSDECLGFLVLLFIIVQIILALRVRINIRQGQVEAQVQGQNGQALANQNASGAAVRRSISNNSLNGAAPPTKQTVSFKQDVCVIAFSKSSWKLNSTQTETLLKYVTDDVKVFTKSPYVIDSTDALRDCPKAKLYIVLVDCNNCVQAEGGGSTLNHEQQQNVEFQMSSLRHLKGSGSHIILVLTDDGGSQTLSSHSLYNTSSALVQSHDVLQELASNGRLLSICHDFSPFQLNHVRKVVKSLLNLKGK